jgi:hypothetical protein
VKSIQQQALKEEGNMGTNQRLSGLGTVPAAVIVGLAGWVCVSGAEEGRQIPLESIYSTTGQKGLKALKMRLDEPQGQELQGIARGYRGGASDVFLVRGKDIAAAVKAARQAFTAGQSADGPVIPDAASRAAPLWVVAYLGSAGSSPPAWLVHSVEVKGQMVRVTFRKPKRFGSTRDLHPYFLWVPLGKVEAGTYTLELFDADKEEVTFLRRVAVAAN